MESVAHQSHQARVSVVVPCFNLGRYVGEAIDSALNQTYSDLEVIVVDDGSTDTETVAFLESLTKPRTRVIRTEHQGLSAARNVGFRISEAEFLCALDADDLLHPTWLARAVARLDADPGLAFVSHWLEAFGDEQWVWKPGRPDLSSLLDVNVFNGAAVLRRLAFNTTRGFDESMRDGCEDWEFWIGVLEAGHRGAIIPEMLYRYRRRAGSMSRTMQLADRDLGLYRELVAKHPTSFATYLNDLVLHREWKILTLSQHIRTLEEEVQDLERTVVQRQSEVASARRRLEAAHETERRAQSLEDLKARVAAAEAREAAAQQTNEEIVEELHNIETREFHTRDENERLSAALTESEADRAKLTAEQVDLQQTIAATQRLREQEVDALKQSWSWRVTAPVRAMYDLLRLGKRS